MSRKTRAPLEIDVYRGPLVESIHHVVAVALDEHGSIYKSWGDPAYVVYPRSSIKPLQALVFLNSGAFEAYGSKLEYLALACASHNGEPKHVQQLKNWAALIGVNESDLACGPVEGSRFRHNCSGKHMAAMSACRHMGWPIKDYYLYEHPFQQAVRKQLSDLTGLKMELLPHGGDGCGFPTIAMPLQQMAAAFLPFVTDKKKGILPGHTEVIMEALAKHPDLFSGTDDLAEQLIRKTDGKVFVKPGAEGAYCGFAPDKKMTFAVKALDGAHRAAWVAMLNMFFELKIITAAQYGSLLENREVARLNSRGELIGTYKILGSAITQGKEA
ncbi:MAG: asparaginase [Bdellovibrionota bacterium]